MLKNPHTHNPRGSAAVAQQVIQEDPSVDLIETNLRFTRPLIEEHYTLMGVIYVQRRVMWKSSAP